MQHFQGVDLKSHLKHIGCLSAWRDSDKHDDSEIIIVASLCSSSAFSTGDVDLQKKALNHLQSLCFLSVLLLLLSPGLTECSRVCVIPRKLNFVAFSYPATYRNQRKHSLFQKENDTSKSIHLRNKISLADSGRQSMLNARDRMQWRIPCTRSRACSFPEYE